MTDANDHRNAIMGADTIYGLFLNDMRMQMEYTKLVAVSTSPDRLRALLESEKAAEPYSNGLGRDMCGGELHKVFKADGPLEFYNPPDSLEVDSPSLPEYARTGIFTLNGREQHMRKAGEEWDAAILSKVCV